MNRALARRPMLENERDMEKFLELMGEVAERGWLRWHAFALLQTHFHALVESPNGQMSMAMRHLQLGYVRYFNRSRRRDGPLLRGRFRSKLANSLAYRRTLVGYIDQNPVQAGLVREAAAYPFASCRAYVHGGGPDWLCTEWVEGQLVLKPGEGRGAAYVQCFPRGFDRHQRDHVERRIRCGGGGVDPTDRLLAGGVAAMATWMRRKAWLADRIPVGVPLAPIRTALEELAKAGTAGLAPSQQRLATVLLLAEVCAASVGEIAGALHLSRCMVERTLAQARSLVRRDEAFAGWVAERVAAALGRVYPASKLLVGSGL
jgi:REP element-mobilizing transposase RayT